MEKAERLLEALVRVYINSLTFKKGGNHTFIQEKSPLEQEAAVKVTCCWVTVQR